SGGPPDGQAEADDHAAGGGQDFGKDPERLAQRVGGKEGVLAAVAADAELGQAEDRGALGTGLLDRAEDARLVAAPVERGLVENGGRQLDELHVPASECTRDAGRVEADEDRKSTRLNSSHVKISYAVFCLKKKTTSRRDRQ